MRFAGDERYVLEVGGQSLGLLVAEKNGYTFFSAGPAARALDGKHFASTEAAQRALHALTGKEDAA